MTMTAQTLYTVIAALDAPANCTTIVCNPDAEAEWRILALPRFRPLVRRRSAVERLPSTHRPGSDETSDNHVVEAVEAHLRIRSI